MTKTQDTTVPSVCTAADPAPSPFAFAVPSGVVACPFIAAGTANPVPADEDAFPEAGAPRLARTLVKVEKLGEAGNGGGPAAPLGAPPWGNKKDRKGEDDPG